MEKVGSLNRQAINHLDLSITLDFEGTTKSHYEKLLILVFNSYERYRGLYEAEIAIFLLLGTSSCPEKSPRK